jgi:C-5 cytosine-specific DNA methylase
MESSTVVPIASSRSEPPSSSSTECQSKGVHTWYYVGVAFAPRRSGLEVASKPRVSALVYRCSTCKRLGQRPIPQRPAGFFDREIRELPEFRRDAREVFEVLGFDVEPQPSYPGRFALADVRWLQHGALPRDDLQDLVRPDVVVASPPCQGFSEAQPDKVNRPTWADLEIVRACYSIIWYLRPRFWVIENVRGAARWLGYSTLRYGSFHFWGYFPWFLKASDTPYKSHGLKKMRYRDAAISAKIPFEISNGFAKAMLYELNRPAKGARLNQVQPTT